MINDLPYVTEEVELRAKILCNLFKALDHPHLKVETLSIENLQDDSAGVYDQPSFQNVRNKLKRLHLKIATEHSNASEHDIDIPEQDIVVLRQRFK